MHLLNENCEFHKIQTSFGDAVKVNLHNEQAIFGYVMDLEIIK
jgi:hypothetical protein